MATVERRQLLSSKGFSIKEASDEEDDFHIEVQEAEEVSVCCSYRLLVIVCCTLSMTITYAAQASLSAAMICMIEDRDVHVGVSFLENVTTENGTIFNVTSTNATDEGHNDWLFTWDKSQQGLAISTFFMGYYISQIPSGIAAVRFGPKRVVVVSLILVSIFQVLTVPAAYFGIGWLYADRVIVGIMDGFLYSPTFALAGQWSPRHETSLLFGIVGMGMELGNVLSYAISLLACEIVIQEGWPFVFYIIGALGFIIAALVMVIVSDSPFTNRRISRKEVKFIASCIPKPQPTPDEALNRVPVKEILTSMSVWAIVVSQIGSDWLYYFYVTMEPTFLKDVIKLSNLEVNLLSGLPFLGIIPTIYLSGYLCDRLVTKGTVSNTKIRKFNDFICKIIPSGMLLGLGFLPQESTGAAFVMNLLGAMCMGFSYVSWMANPVDLAPAYTGFIVGICEIGAIWVAIVVPIVFDDITVDKTRQEWQLVFYITAGIQVFCFLFYAFFASGELQPWAVMTSRNEYENLDTQDGDNRPVEEDAIKSRSNSKVSERRRASIENDTHSLALSLSLSLGEFKGTSSYEASVRHKKEARKSDANIASHTVMISGPAITGNRLQSGQIPTEGQHNYYRVNKDAMTGHIKQSQVLPGFYASSGTLMIPKHLGADLGLGLGMFETDRYIESDDDSWHNTATRSLPSNLTKLVTCGRGDLEIHSTKSSPLTSDQFENEKSVGLHRNNKSLATELAEALSVQSLNEQTGNNGNSKPTNGETKVSAEIIESLKRRSNIMESGNGQESDVKKSQYMGKKQSQISKYLDSKKWKGVKNVKQTKYSLNKKAPPDKDQIWEEDPDLNCGSTSSIMKSSEDFPDSMDVGQNKNGRNGKTRRDNREQDSLKNKSKEPRQISGMIRNLFTFRKSKSNPNLSLPNEDTFVFVTDNDITDDVNIDSWTNKSFDSARSTKHPSKRTQNLKNEEEAKKENLIKEEDDEQVLFAHPQNLHKIELPKK